MAKRNNKGFCWDEVVTTEKGILTLVSDDRFVGVFTCSDEAVAKFVRIPLKGIPGLKVSKVYKTNKFEVAFIGKDSAMEKASDILLMLLIFVADDIDGNLYFVNPTGYFQHDVYHLSKKHNIIQIVCRLDTEHGLFVCATNDQGDKYVQNPLSFEAHVERSPKDAIRACYEVLETIKKA